MFGFRVEYTDCLGRTRTCLRKDLEYLKSKDAELRSSIDLKERGGQILPEEEQEALEEKAKRESDKNNEKQEDDLSEQNELLSADMRREILRRQWEKEEDALRNKKDIHYQDILFNGKCPCCLTNFLLHFNCVQRRGLTVWATIVFQKMKK